MQRIRMIIMIPEECFAALVLPITQLELVVDTK